ncbi:MAG: hypothetical protein EKK46_11765 [Rhodocyclaceae bacterium]|nr:MAG: hypothetical protein EKK46_11765 [Rhodocyclaceae bacterium]
MEACGGTPQAALGIVAVLIQLLGLGRRLGLVDLGNPLAEGLPFRLGFLGGFNTFDATPALSGFGHHQPHFFFRVLGLAVIAIALSHGGQKTQKTDEKNGFKPSRGVIVAPKASVCNTFILSGGQDSDLEKRAIKLFFSQGDPALSLMQAFLGNDDPRIVLICTV